MWGQNLWFGFWDEMPIFQWREECVCSTIDAVPRHFCIYVPGITDKGLGIGDYGNEVVYCHTI
jgi:hypothetical protein